MDLQTAIKTVIDRHDLSSDEMQSVMETIMTGNATQAQIGGFLVGLQMKGETVAEIAAAAKVMRELATPVEITGDHIVDTCGTGGDGASTFNVSTASAFVVSAAGATVAKHGNRSISSSSGSADVLEAAGVNLDISAEQVKKDGFPFEVLSDSTSKVMKDYKLYFELPSDLMTVYKEHGLDIEEFNGEGRNGLPTPGAFIIDTNGVIRTMQAEVDYKSRMAPEDILKALAQL